MGGSSQEKLGTALICEVLMELVFSDFGETRNMLIIATE